MTGRVQIGELVAPVGGSGGGGTAAPVPDTAADVSTDQPAGDAGGRPVALANGGTVDLDSFAGQDVLFWFWAPW